MQIPATDVGRSVDFYETIFGWHIRRRGDGEIAFDDTSGRISGAWVTDRPPSGEPGLLLYIRVDSVERALEKIVEAGGEVVTPLTAQGEGEAYATFRDPAGKRPGHLPGARRRPV